MKEKNLRVIIYVFGAICLYIFFAIRIFPLMNLILSEKMDPVTRDFGKYGELYYFSCIEDFKVDFPDRRLRYRLSDKHPVITEAEILTYGDSFFDSPFQKNLPELLSDTLETKVYSYVTYDPTRSNPFCVLKEFNYPRNKQSKVFIYEAVERNIPFKFGREFNAGCPENSQEYKTVYREIIDFVFKNNAENLFDVLLKQSIFTAKAYSFISTVKFRLFGRISPLTSKYKVGSDPWLFHEKEYSNQKGGFYYKYHDEEIQSYADNILIMKNKLKSIYNLDLIFIPIPTKYTIYHKLINNDPYNNFLPRLQKELDKRGVTYVDLYTEYKNSAEILYHGTDTHWNEKGINIAISLLLKSLNMNNQENFPDILSSNENKSLSNHYIISPEFQKKTE